MADFDPDAYLAKKTAPQAFDPDAYLKSKTAAQEPEGPGLIHQALDYGTRALDYPGGLLRTGLAEVAGLGKNLVQGKNPLNEKQVVSDTDVANAFKGKAPKSSEYLKRLGLDEGGDIPGAGPFSPIPSGTTLRDVEGFGLDIATDPASLIAKSKALPEAVGSKLRAVTEAPTNALEAAGESMYKSGFKKIDERLAEKGTKPLSDVLMERGIWGSSKSVKTQADALAKELGVSRQAIYDEADKLGQKINVEEAMQPALQKSRSLQSQRGLEGTGKELEESTRALYEPTGKPKVVSSYTVPSKVVEGEKGLITPQYGPHGEVLNADDLVSNKGSYYVPGKSYLPETIRGAHGEILNKGLITESAGSIPGPAKDFNVKMDVDPATLKQVNIREPIASSRQNIPTETSRIKDVNVTDTNVPYETFSPKETKAPDVKIPESTIDIVQDPSKKFNWLTMRDEKIKLPPLSLSEASQLKTNLRNTLPASAFDPIGKVKGPAKEVTKAQASGLRQAIEDAAEKVRPGAGKEISALNEDLGSLLESQKPLRMQVRREVTPNHASSVDAGLAGYAIHEPISGGSILAAKKLGDLSKTTRFRSGGGLLLQKLAQNPEIDDATRRALINILRPEN